MKNYKNYINGQWLDAVSGETFTVVNPATGEVIANCAKGGKKDAEMAIEAARNAFFNDKHGWRRMGVQKRSEMLYQLADCLEKAKHEFARCETENNGKPLREAMCDVEDAVSYMRYYAGAIRMPLGATFNVNDSFGPMHTYTVKEPVGVCGLITPWNYPLLMGVQKIAPALAAGNTIVFKPSSVTPVTAVKLFELMEEIGFPKGTANIVMGSGLTVGKELSSSPHVDMVSFTGSTQSGQDIYRLAAKNIKKISLELGGKSPNIIFADADIDGAVEWAMMGVFFNQGEVCSAGSRILVEEKIKDEFVEKLSARARAMTIGNGMDNPDMGPLVSKKHMEKVLEYIEIGKKDGCKMVCGGRVSSGELAKGYFVAPTIFDNCPPDSRIIRDEIFGPVVTIQTFKTECEAIEMANDTEFGLAGGVFTSDGAKALRVANEVRAGVMWVNCYNPAFIEAPWGGFKKSGIGRELGLNGLEEYMETKQIAVSLAPGEIGWYKKR
ncbi:MAG: aldehyde dehydrogenase family protein [Firmicutes bacterium]|nr:aldehyde dehydrogenase family protein [Bacillota bacterium]